MHASPELSKSHCCAVGSIASGRMEGRWPVLSRSGISWSQCVVVRRCAIEAVVGSEIDALISFVLMRHWVSAQALEPINKLDSQGMVGSSPPALLHSRRWWRGRSYSVGDTPILCHLATCLAIDSSAFRREAKVHAGNPMTEFER